jgi:hypothetical protein
MNATAKVWVVFGKQGPFRGIYNNRKAARDEARWRNEGPYTWKPYRVVRATLSWAEQKAKEAR